MKKLLLAGLFALTVALPAHAKNIVQTAASTGKFEILLAAAQEAGLAGALSTTQNITVFAPTDEAFERLPKFLVDDLLKPENRDRLAALLSYHVVPAKVPSTAATIRPQRIQTLKSEGDQTIRVQRINDRVYVDTARVVQADVKASNGIIHVINKVLLPAF